jgi:serine/threonine-protein kinase PknG
VTPCNRPGCAGTVDETGFCDECFRLPVRTTPDPLAGDGNAPASAATPPPPPASSHPTPDSSGASRPTGSGQWWGGDLVSLPCVEVPDPAGVVLTDPHVPEGRRFCRSCAKNGLRVKIGRSRADQPARTEGWCPRCGAQYSFSPKLAAGAVVSDRYEVVGCLAHGGVGWVYLACDRNLDGKYRALKGLINTSDTDAVESAVAERRFLTMVDHPNIVRIFDFVTHPDPSGGLAGYIVMDYVGGWSLQEAIARSYRGDDPLSIEDVILYGLEVLAALDYLHGSELLYCDLKPDNVIRSGCGIKLIDLGAVRAFDAPPGKEWGTSGFQVSGDEIRGRGVSVASDLHTVGRTLRALFEASPDSTVSDGTSPIAVGVASFWRLVRRAAHGEPERRFSTAAETADQLRGVLREVLSLRDGKPRSEPSTMFQHTPALLDAGLGAVPALDRWTSAGTADAADGRCEVLADGRPSPASVAAGLPVPHVDRNDPAADFLVTVSATDPRQLIRELAAFPQPSDEIELWRCRAHVALSDFGGAAEDIATAAKLAPYDWRVSWHRGLLALAQGKVGDAEREFEHAYAALPGEAAPKLALGYCAEQLGKRTDADRYYRAVWTDRSQVSAAFGLVRGCVARNDRASAVATLDQVPPVSRHRDAAMIAAVRVCAGRLPVAAEPAGGIPTRTDLDEAVRRLRQLDLDGGQPHGESRDRLTAAVRQAALDWIGQVGPAEIGRDAPGEDDDVLGSPLTEQRLRFRLERSFRELARQADTKVDHAVLVDLANTVRPRTPW